MNTPREVDAPDDIDIHSGRESEHQQSLQTSLQDALDTGDTTLFTRFSLDETMERLEQVDTLFLDLDGTCLEQGATVFPPGFVQKLEQLQKGGVRIVFVTGKPETEVRALMQNVDDTIPLSFIYERAGYRLDRDATGAISRMPWLADANTERTVSALSDAVYTHLAPELQKQYNVRLVPAGDGRHQSLLSVDILRGDAPADYENHPRYDLKVSDAAILTHVRNRMLTMLETNFPAWSLTDLGNANFELHKTDQTKDNGVLRTDEFQTSTGIRLAVDDSRNGLSMLRLKETHDRFMTGVIFNRHTSAEVVDAADMGVAGEATVDVLLEKIIQAKGIEDRVFVISNTPPFQKKGGAFVTSIGAPVAISTAVEHSHSRWFFPSQTPQDFRGGDTPADRADLLRKMIPVGITPAQHTSHYGNIANRVIWKAAHPDAFPDVPDFPDVDWDNYQLVNRNIAREVQQGINGSKNPTVVWVHDFQVAAIASELRNMYDRQKLKIGFFWHIPFPEASRFIQAMDKDGSGRRCRQLLTWFSKYDVVGFHTAEYVRNYHEACRLLGVKPARTVVQPISIDTEGMAEQALAVMNNPLFTCESPALNRIFDTIRSSSNSMQIVLDGLERADPIKGSKPRLEALLDLAMQQPELFDGKIVIEGLTESRTATDSTYAQYYAECLRLIDQINDALSHRDVVQQITTIGRQDVVALLTQTDKAMFTSVADGFNMSGPELLVAWNATRHITDRKRTMFISDQTGFVKSLGEKGFRNAVPVARGPITRASLREPIRSLLAGETPEPDYEQLTEYFGVHSIQEWVRVMMQKTRHSDPGRVERVG